MAAGNWIGDGREDGQRQWQDGVFPCRHAGPRGLGSGGARRGGARFCQIRAAAGGCVRPTEAHREVPTQADVRDAARQGEGGETTRWDVSRRFGDAAWGCVGQVLQRSQGSQHRRRPSRGLLPAIPGPATRPSSWLRGALWSLRGYSRVGSFVEVVMLVEMVLRWWRRGEIDWELASGHRRQQPWEEPWGPASLVLSAAVPVGPALNPAAHPHIYRDRGPWGKAAISPPPRLPNCYSNINKTSTNTASKHSVESSIARWRHRA